MQSSFNCCDESYTDHHPILFFSLSSSMWLSKPCTRRYRCQNAMFPPTVSSKTNHAGCTLEWCPPWMKQWVTSLWLCSREDCGRIQSWYSQQACHTHLKHFAQLKIANTSFKFMLQWEISCTLINEDIVTERCH